VYPNMHPTRSTVLVAAADAMAFRTAGLVAVVALACLAVANAQCIECKVCGCQQLSECHLAVDAIAAGSLRTPLQHSNGVSGHIVYERAGFSASSRTTAQC